MFEVDADSVSADDRDCGLGVTDSDTIQNRCSTFPTDHSIVWKSCDVIQATKMSLSEGKFSNLRSWGLRPWKFHFINMILADNAGAAEGNDGALHKPWLRGM